jgi:hypothetical protein
MPRKNLGGGTMHSGGWGLRLFITILVLAAWVTRVYSQDGPADKQDPKQNILNLIDKLPDIAELKVPHIFPWWGGNGPLGTLNPIMSRWGQKWRSQSNTMREFVKRGAGAVPHLIAHLDDQRPTKITIEHYFGIGRMFYLDEYDYNVRTAKEPPQGVNRSLGQGNQGNPPRRIHTVTVGDLCFVALGPPKEGNYAARACLVELYGYPTGVKSKDRPCLFPLDDRGQSLLIYALINSSSNKIDQAVQKVLYSTDDDGLANACVLYLICRGNADADIRQYVERNWKSADLRNEKNWSACGNAWDGHPFMPLPGSTGRIKSKS